MPESRDNMNNTATEPLSRATINGIDYAWIEQGEGPLVLLLHGFPDTAHGYQALMQQLAAAGYRAVAPFLRGYHPTGLAADGDYSMLALAGDVLALMDYFSPEPALVIGHDWGGLAAGTAANMQPQRFRKLVYMCIPHMHGSQFSWAQLQKSWYVLFFQLPSVPERVVARNTYHFIDRLYRNWSPNWDFTAEDTAAIKRSLSAPGCLPAALAYYRALIRGTSAELREIMSRQTSVATLVVYGEVDGSIGRDQFTTIASCFSGEVSVLAMPGVGHFPQREASNVLAQKVLEFFTDGDIR
jgi:pimeloyl-ACP methyl ester carboxylesterase